MMTVNMLTADPDFDAVTQCGECKVVKKDSTDVYIQGNLVVLSINVVDMLICQKSY